MLLEEKNKGGFLNVLTFVWAIAGVWVEGRMIKLLTRFQQIDLFAGNIKGPNEESLAGKGEFCKLINYATVCCDRYKNLNMHIYHHQPPLTAFNYVWEW